MISDSSPSYRITSIGKIMPLLLNIRIALHPIKRYLRFQLKKKDLFPLKKPLTKVIYEY